MPLNRKIYLASSWRNPHQPTILKALRDAGHEVYDFRNPAPGNTGFSWSEIDPNWQNWIPEEFAIQLATHHIAADGFSHDKAALEWCDTCILALPCGRSAHLELGYAAGQGKDTYVLLHEDKFEPELMYLLNTACSTDINTIIEWMAWQQPNDVMRWHTVNGGNFKRPAAHALRLLREVIELCVASGATEEEIFSHSEAEIQKATDRNEWGGDPIQVPIEWADCQLLLDVIRGHAGFSGNEVYRNKLDILYTRLWEADKDGVLWRPGTANLKAAA